MPTTATHEMGAIYSRRAFHKTYRAAVSRRSRSRIRQGTLAVNSDSMSLACMSLAWLEFLASCAHSAALYCFREHKQNFPNDRPHRSKTGREPRFPCLISVLTFPTGNSYTQCCTRLSVSLSRTLAFSLARSLSLSPPPSLPPISHTHKHAQKSDSKYTHKANLLPPHYESWLFPIAANCLSVIDVVTSARKPL